MLVESIVVIIVVVVIIKFYHCQSRKGEASYGRKVIGLCVIIMEQRGGNVRAIESRCRFACLESLKDDSILRKAN